MPQRYKELPFRAWSPGNEIELKSTVLGKGHGEEKLRGEYEGATVVKETDKSYDLWLPTWELPWEVKYIAKDSDTFRTGVHARTLILPFLGDLIMVTGEIRCLRDKLRDFDLEDELLWSLTEEIEFNCSLFLTTYYADIYKGEIGRGLMFGSSKKGWIGLERLCVRIAELVCAHDLPPEVEEALTCVTHRYLRSFSALKNDWNSAGDPAKIFEGTSGLIVTTERGHMMIPRTELRRRLKFVGITQSVARFGMTRTEAA